MSREPIDPARRAEALELARTEGVAAAAERTGVKPGTLRVWLSREAKRAGKAAAPAQATPTAAPADGLGAFESRILERAKNAVELAIQRLEEMLPSARGVQSVAISAGILLDKVERLHQVIAEQQEREVRIAERDAKLIMRSIEHFFEVLELPFTGSSRKTWATLLGRLEHGEPLGVPPEALEARVELQQAMRRKWEVALRREIRAEVEAEFERAREPRMLPPAPPDVPMPEPEPEPEPPEPEPDDGVEVVTGEVVAEPIVEPGGWTVDPVSGRRTRPFRPGGRPPAGRQFGRGAW